LHCARHEPLSIPLAAARPPVSDVFPDRERPQLQLQLCLRSREIHHTKRDSDPGALTLHPPVPYIRYRIYAGG